MGADLELNRVKPSLTLSMTLGGWSEEKLMVAASEPGTLKKELARLQEVKNWQEVREELPKINGRHLGKFGSEISEAISTLERFIHPYRVQTTGKPLASLSSALIEVLNNHFMHGNRLDPRKTIKINAQMSHSPHRLVIETSDEGRGFDVNKVPSCIDDDNLEKTTGRGLFMTNKVFSHQMKVLNGGTSYCLTFNLELPPESA